MTVKFTIEGVTFRTASQRRFVVVAGRATGFEGRRWSSIAIDSEGRQGAYVPETFQPFKGIVKRSDNVHTAKAAAAKHGTPAGGFCVVVDTVGDTPHVWDAKAQRWMQV